MVQEYAGKNTIKYWKVVGGEGLGGILVRCGSSLASTLEHERLSTNAVIQEVGREGERLRFRKLTGNGPDAGWVSVRAGGKELVIEHHICDPDPDLADVHGLSSTYCPHRDARESAAESANAGVDSRRRPLPLEPFNSNIEDKGRASLSKAAVVSPNKIANRFIRCRRVIVVRHGSRPDNRVDPPLDTTGVRQAEQVAAYLASKSPQWSDIGIGISAIYCSPFTRALQTAMPVALALNLKIRIEWGFCELLAHKWLHQSDPLPALRERDLGSSRLRESIDWKYETAVMPEYPDVVGRMRAGMDQQREKALKRHRLALEHALSRAAGGSIIIVGHGATHDFVPAALCPNEHPVKHHTPFCAPHCSFTTLEESSEGWHILDAAATPWREGETKQHHGFLQPSLKLNSHNQHTGPSEKNISNVFSLSSSSYLRSDPLARLAQRHGSFRPEPMYIVR